MNATATPAKPLLDLATVDPVDRPFITIDGKRYDLAVSADFGILDFARLDGLVDRLNALREAAEGTDVLSDDAVDELSGILTRGARMVLRAPAEVIASLNDTQRLAVVQAFTAASRTRTPEPTTPAATKPNRAARRRTGERSSRSCRTSTRATTAG